MTSGRPRALEFFAGIGLMRAGLADAGIDTVWANDNDADKAAAYGDNFGRQSFVLGDIRDVSAQELPEADVATASFPCTDLSVAGARRGLGDMAAPKGARRESSMFWEFARLLRDMRSRRPRAVVCENVHGFASSGTGRDLYVAVEALNNLGYSCDILSVDARHFVPQSRPRMFIVGLQEPPPSVELLRPSPLRPAWALRFLASSPDLRLHIAPLPPLPDGPGSLDGYLEAIDSSSTLWWAGARRTAFVDSLSPLQTQRLRSLQRGRDLVWRTAYRRTREGRAVWEIRADGIAGCLRTARGGSSKQAVVEAGRGRVRVRWMTPREYALLMGAPSYKLPARTTHAVFGFGDAVCVPVVRWLAQTYLLPYLRGRSPHQLLEAA